MSGQKSNTRIETPVKFNMTGPTHNISKNSSKVYLSNANKVLSEDVLKPRSLATCNLTHKDANILHVKLDIRKHLTTKHPDYLQKLSELLKQSQTTITCQHTLTIWQCCQIVSLKDT